MKQSITPYMAARDGEKLKAFSFAKIENLRVLESRFPADPDIDRKLAEEDGIWLNDDKKEIVLKIDQEVAGYFKRRKLIANQVSGLRKTVMKRIQTTSKSSAVIGFIAIADQIRQTAAKCIRSADIRRYRELRRFNELT